MLRELLNSKGIKYLRATYYFGDAAPFTCWDGYRSELVDLYLEKIAKDGFNCIIILVPAGLPQIESKSADLGAFFWRSLSELMAKAQIHGLYVLFRIGYIWDRFPIELDRYRLTLLHHLPGDERDALGSFLTRLYAHCGNYGNFLYGFITWEDATLFLIDHSPRLDMKGRISIAKMIGYEGNSEKSIPAHNDPGFKHFLEYVDDILVRFFIFVKAQFPLLSMEVRCDFYPYRDENGRECYHVHSKTFDLPDTDVIGTYYGIYMEARNQRETLSAEMAFENFIRAQYRILSSTSHLNRPLVFIDQFLFCMREREFSHFAWMEESEQSRFIEMCGKWMQGHGVGYAAWSFQDYLLDGVSNSAFALGLDGWKHSGSVALSSEGGPSCKLGTGSALWQLLPEKLLSGFILFEVRASEDSEIKIRHSEDSGIYQNIRADIGRHKIFENFNGEAYFLSIEVVRGEIEIYKASIGTDIASHGAYSIDFSSTATSAALISLNRMLGAF